jgi:hypothetical protein
MGIPRRAAIGASQREWFPHARAPLALWHQGSDAQLLADAHAQSIGTDIHAP